MRRDASAFYHNLGICLETSSLEVAESALCSERKAVGILKALGQGASNNLENMKAHERRVLRAEALEQKGAIGSCYLE